MGTTPQVATYAEEEASGSSFCAPAVKEGLHGRIPPHNPGASLFAKEILKLLPTLCRCF